MRPPNGVTDTRRRPWRLRSPRLWTREQVASTLLPRKPEAMIHFINAAAVEILKLDSDARVLPGTMGANHLEPRVRNSPVARTLYCASPISAYTLHAYAWRSPTRWGDMPIHWDFERCPCRRPLPARAGPPRLAQGTLTSAP